MVGLTPRPKVWRCSSNWAEQLSRKQQCVSSNLTIASKRGPCSRRRSSKPNLQELGGKARGSTPPRASKIRNGCVAQEELEQASHKREVGGSTPPTATKFLGLVM